MLTPFTRKLKQTNVFLSGLIFVLAIAAIIWFFVSKPEPIGEIESLEIGEIKSVLKTKERGWEPPFTYKVSAKIKNPNEKFIAQEIEYIFEAKDEKNTIIQKKEGGTDLGKSEEEEVKEEITLDKPGKNINFNITRVKWNMAND
jgi:hypothetical protein